MAALDTQASIAHPHSHEHMDHCSDRKTSGYMKIDVFPAMFPPAYATALQNKGLAKAYFEGRFGIPIMPSMVNVEERLRTMDRYEGYAQILNVSLPPVEDIAKPKVAIELAKIANDSMAELVMTYPDKFVAAAACLPMNDMNAAVKELERAIEELRFKALQITTTIMDKPLSSPEFEPLFERMHYYNLPILMHPRSMNSGPRKFNAGFNPYSNLQEEATYWSEIAFNWPYETTLAMGNIAISGLLDKYPNLKIVTHHCGGMTPYQIHRIYAFRDFSEMRLKNYKTYRLWTRKQGDYYKMFYGDTAVYGNTDALTLGHKFFGTDHILFSTDMPWDSQDGARFVRESIRSVELMNVSEADREKIYSGNAKKLFRLPV